MDKYELIKKLSKNIRIKIYDSVWIDEDEEVYMEKTDDIVESCIDNFLRDLVDNNMIKWINIK